MKRYLIAGLLLLSGCGIQQVTEETRNEVKKTNDAVHLQILSISLDGLLSEEKTAGVETITIPTRMFADAKAFAENAYAEEIVSLIHVFNKDMTEGYQGDALTFTKENLRLHDRWVSFVAGALIAAFTPAEKVDAILRDHIENDGRYKDAAYVFAALRYFGLKTYLIADATHAKHPTLSLLRESMKYYRALKLLAAKPYTSDMVVVIKKFTPTSVTPTGEVVDPQDLPLPFEASKVQEAGNEIRDLVAEMLPANVKGSAEVQGILQELPADVE